MTTYNLPFTLTLLYYIISLCAQILNEYMYNDIIIIIIIS